MTDEKSPLSPIDLAREPDFQLAALSVSPSTRQVSRGDWHETLEPRVMQVLVALHQGAGRVVSRDELIARCWDGRIVGEDAINRTLGKLRRLSESDASFAIETVTKVGYRLLAAGQAPPTALAPPAQKSAKRLRWGAAAVLIVALIAGVAAFLIWPASHWTVESSRPFLSSLALEDFPAFSPNGAMLAYASGADGGPRQIYVRNLAGGEGVKITSDTYDDLFPVWSSDNARLVYIAIKPGEPCRIMMTTVPAGESRQVGRCRGARAPSLAWQPGTPFLYVSEAAGLKGAFIYRLDLDSGAQQQILQEPSLGDYISDLHCSPDGKWLAFLVRGSGLVIRDLTGKDGEKHVGDIAARGAWDSSMTWAEDSKTLLVSISDGVGSEIDAFPLNGEASYRLYTTAANIGHIAAGNGTLALVTDTSRVNLARASATPATPPDLIDAASELTWSPTFAPDGTMAFLSNRSGGNAIWLLKPGAVAPVPLLDVGMTPAYRIRYSPDGTKMALAIETPAALKVKVLTADGATLTSFDMPSLGLGLPTWTPDGKNLLLFDRGPKQTFRIAIDNPAHRSAFAAPHWVGITITRDGTFATRADKPGIWRIDGKAPVLLTAHYPAYRDAPLAMMGDDVLLPVFEAGGPAKLFAQPLAGGPERLVAYAPGATDGHGFSSTFMVNPKTSEIVYTTRVAHDTNIDLLTLARR